MRAGQFLPQFEGYRAFIPAPLPPNPPVRMDEELTRLLSDADRCLGRLDGVASVLPNPDLFVAMYVRHEAVLSSQIEGTQSTLEDVLEFFLRGVYEVSQSATSTARTILNLREQHRQAVADVGAGGAGARLLDYLFQQPIVTIRMVEKKIECSYVTANKLVDQLVELKMLREITGQQRNRRYRYEPYLALFETPPAPIE